MRIILVILGVAYSACVAALIHDDNSLRETNESLRRANAELVNALSSRHRCDEDRLMDQERVW